MTEVRLRISHRHLMVGMANVCGDKIECDCVNLHPSVCLADPLQPLQRNLTFTLQPPDVRHVAVCATARIDELASRIPGHLHCGDGFFLVLRRIPGTELPHSVS